MVAGKMVGLTSDLHGRATYAKLIASERGRGVRRRVGTSEGVGSGGVRVSGGVGGGEKEVCGRAGHAERRRVDERWSYREGGVRESTCQD